MSSRCRFPIPTAPPASPRPALVVSTDNDDGGFELLWVVMITSAENRGWPDDIDLAKLDGTGLPAPSLVRTAKIATIETGDACGTVSLVPVRGGDRTILRRLFVGNQSPDALQ